LSFNISISLFFVSSPYKISNYFSLILFNSLCLLVYLRL
jgi:hypothetical protein